MKKQEIADVLDKVLLIAYGVTVGFIVQEFPPTHDFFALPAINILLIALLVIAFVVVNIFKVKKTACIHGSYYRQSHPL